MVASCCRRDLTRRSLGPRRRRSPIDTLLLGRWQCTASIETNNIDDRIVHCLRRCDLMVNEFTTLRDAVDITFECQACPRPVLVPALDP